MAAETQIDSQLLATAALDDLKKIDIWALLMTIYIIINSDQSYLFAQDINEELKNLIVLGKFSL